VPSCVVGSGQDERFMANVEPGRAAFVTMVGVEPVLFDGHIVQELQIRSVFVNTINQAT